MAHQSMIRVGVLGAGRHSFATHGPALREIVARQRCAAAGNDTAGGQTSLLPRIELAAVCDIDREKALRYAEDFGFLAVHSSLHEMAAMEKLDVLLLITPLSLTEKITTQVLPLGIPSLIEKPPGTGPEQTRRLLALARRTGTAHMISFNRRFNPAFRRALDWIAEDPAQRSPRTVAARMLRHDRREEHFATGTGIHLIDAVIALMGPPRKVSSANAPLDPACRFFNARLEFDRGVSANILIAPACGRHEEVIEAYGNHFSFEVDFFANRFRVFRKKTIVEEWRLPDTENPQLADVLAETEHLLRSLGERVIRPNLEDGLASMLVAAAIQDGCEETLMV